MTNGFIIHHVMRSNGRFLTPKELAYAQMWSVDPRHLVEYHVPILEKRSTELSPRTARGLLIDQEGNVILEGRKERGNAHDHPWSRYYSAEELSEKMKEFTEKYRSAHSWFDETAEYHQSYEQARHRWYTKDAEGKWHSHKPDYTDAATGKTYDFKTAEEFVVVDDYADIEMGAYALMREQFDAKVKEEFFEDKRQGKRRNDWLPNGQPRGGKGRRGKNRRRK